MQGDELLHWICRYGSRTYLESRIDVTEVLEAIVDDGALDMEPLTAQDVLSGLQNDADAKWKDLAFGLDEVLAYYLALEKLEEPEWCLKTAICAITCVLGLANAIRNNHGDWDFSFRKTMRICEKTDEFLTLDARVKVLLFAFEGWQWDPVED